MTGSNEGDPSIGPPPGVIPIDPVEGFGPHISDEFIYHYGEESVFVTATVDCLTTRFVGVLRRAGRVPEDHVAVQHGPPEMREALEQLLACLTAQGLDKPHTLLMRSAVGHEAPQSFMDEAGSLLGEELLAIWLRQLEGEDYLSAKALLKVQ